MSKPSPLALYAVFNQNFTLDSTEIQKRLEQILGGTAGLFAKPKKVQLTTVAQSEVGGVIDVQFDDHTLQLVAITAPVPPTEIEYPLQVAHLRPDHKDQMRQHRAHSIIYYRGETANAVEKFIALYQVAYACEPLGLIGVINPQTWMCLVTPMLADTVKPNFINSFRQSPAAGLTVWLGFVKFFRTDQKTWFATRGAPLFGIPDFAYLATLSEADAALNMFGTLVSYVYDTQARLAAGHTIQLPGDIYLHFGRVTEYAEFLGQDTLVLERIPASGINRGSS